MAEPTTSDPTTSDPATSDPATSDPATSDPATSDLSDEEYRRLLEFRTGLRRFIRWSEEAASAIGVTPAQHQLLLAVRGHDDRRGPTIGDLAAHLLLRHHSTVELVDRTVTVGLVERAADPDDARVVRVRLTRDGGARLSELSAAHLQELGRLVPRMAQLWDGV